MFEIQLHFTVEEARELVCWLEVTRQLFVDRKIKIENELAQTKAAIAQLREKLNQSQIEPEYEL